jgi:phosphohistidine phosphatase SixA
VDDQAIAELGQAVRRQQRGLAKLDHVGHQPMTGQLGTDMGQFIFTLRRFDE